MTTKTLFRRSALNTVCRWALTGSVLISSAPVLSADLPASLPSQQVTVTSKQPDLDEHSYRDMLAAMKMFEPYQRVHPDAQLRFRIRQRKDVPGVDMADLVVFIADHEDGKRTRLDVAPDGSFTLPVLPEQAKHNAVVRTNQPPGSLTWYVQVTRNGADPRDRTLGDLRMECKLDLYAAELLRGFKPPAFYAARAISNICENRGMRWGTFAEKPIFAVHLKQGSRDEGLSSTMLYGGAVLPVYYAMLDISYLLRDYTYMVPLYDSSWPDNTVVHITYVDDAPNQQGANDQ